MTSTQTNNLLRIAHSGLEPKAGQRRKIVIVGAGMAGLVTAYELGRAGHEVTILEAQQRVGGRILTIREPFSHGLHGEAGAMRIPTSHKLTNAYIEKFNLPTLEFTKGSANSFSYIGGRKYSRSEMKGDPASLGFDLAVPDEIQRVMQFWVDFIRNTAEKMEADEGYWDELVIKYGDYSLHEFFKSQGWSTEAITTLALMEGLESVMGNSFLDLLQVEVPLVGAKLIQIVGGMDQLPMAFLPKLNNSIVFDAEMIALDYTEDSATVHYKNRTGINKISGDFAILTLPYPALRFVDVLKPFSYPKQRAIRQLHYANAAKIFIQSRRRFWEEDDNIFGGVSITDLPNYLVCYPDHGRATGRGVLIGSYTYGEAANRWGALPPEERITQTLKYLARLHPQISQEFEVGASKVWSEDKFAGGGFAQFEPGQQSRLYSHMIAPEGPIHFAGEHASLKHMWIEGAVESGLRAAQEVHQRSFAAKS